MKMNRLVGFCSALCFFLPIMAMGSSLLSFEDDLVVAGQSKKWGEHGEAWGDVAILTAGTTGATTTAHSGKRVLAINIPTGTWNGAFQERIWLPEKDCTFEAYYQITGGDLPSDARTLMKVEFYNAARKQIGETVSPVRQMDTGGKWVKETVAGTTPAGTAFVRFVLIAGDNAEGEPIKNRIFWDDLSIR